MVAFQRSLRKQALKTGAVDLRGQSKAQCYLGLGSPWRVTVYLRSFLTLCPALSLPCQMFRSVSLPSLRLTVYPSESLLPGPPSVHFSMVNSHGRKTWGHEQYFAEGFWVLGTAMTRPTHPELGLVSKVGTHIL